MFESRNRSSAASSANRWLLVAGAGLVILAFVARMLLDIGQTRVTDLAASLRPDTATATTPAATVAEKPAPARDAAAVADTAPSVTVALPVPVLKADAAPRPAAAPAHAATGYAVQIGAFGSRPNAEKLVAKAATIGFAADVIPQQRGATSLYLVRVGGLTGAPEARQASDSLTRGLGVRAVVIPPGR